MSRNSVKLNHNFKNIAKKLPQKNNKFANNLIIYGRNCCFAALKNEQRHIIQVIISKNFAKDSENFAKLQNLLQQRKLVHLFQIVEIEAIEKLVDKTHLHQGIVVVTQYLSLYDQNVLLSQIYQMQEQEQKLPNLIFLDQICDPQNVGAIIRSAVAFDCNFILFPQHNSVIETAATIKASAGNIELAQMFVITNINNLLEKLKKIGYWSFGLDAAGSFEIKNLGNYQPLILIIGSEGFGIRNLVKKNCDFLAKININTKVESLNASVAAAIAINYLKN
jgi:23S rRNA (guanosine2251-2'-O)-methyltransferase